MVSQHILIIEDSPSIASFLYNILAKLGYENIYVADNGKSGLELFAELTKLGKQPVVLLDYGLPDMTASEVMSGILGKYPDAKIIIETAEEKTSESIKNLLKQGAYQYIQKPIRFDDLKNVMYILERENKLLENKPTETKQTEVIPVSKPSFKKSTFVIFSIFVSLGLIIFLSNYGNFYAVQITSSMSLVVAAFLAIFSTLIFTRSTGADLHKSAPPLFLVFGVSNLIGEIIDKIYGEIYHAEPIISLADFFWILSILSLAIFLYLVTTPLRKFVSTNTKALLIIVPIVIVIPSYFLVYGDSTNINMELAISLAYPTIEAFALWPAMIGVIVYVKNIRNHFWVGIFSATILYIIADTLFVALTKSNSYYTGHPMDVLYIWADALFCFAAYHYLKSAQYHKTDLFYDKTKYKKSIKSQGMLVISLVIVSVIISSTLYVVNIFEFEHYTSNESVILSVILPMAIVSMLAFFIWSIITRRNLVSLYKKIENMEGTKDMFTSRLDFEVNDSSTEAMIIKKLEKLEQSSRKRTSAVVMSAVMVAIILIFYMSGNLFHSETHTQELTSGRFLIENLKGDNIDTWIAWGLFQGEPLHVTIINAHILSPDKIDVIKNAILSEESVEIKNAILDKSPPDLATTYYKGWKGALEKAAQKNTVSYIPQDFEIIESDKSSGDIVIILSTLSEADGSLAFTRSIADEEQHNILKSFITLFDVQNLDSDELSAIVRHEFGHALGLAHSTATEDLMYPSFRTDYPFISQCDIDAIISLYDNKQTNQVTCQN